ncbi:solute carrier family 22 member 14 isoform X4 [Zalophus californianus]|uniref:Solute carrier family 22 member 14 isoform X4 n=1 Tax=Zalophus californianus TaxID=9704 RepID=A0A6J2CDY6_ZALCA|nr:solute carrier family 22 member 14 isoform X4 [Zalophus californianus]
MRRLWKEQAALTGNVSSQVATESNGGKVKRRSHYPSTKLNQLEAPEHTQSPSLEMLLRRLRATEAQQDDKFANILDVVGEFGTFQKRLVALTFIPNILLAFFMFADIFVFTAQKPYCNTSWILAVDPNLSEAQQLNLTLPREPNGSFQTCLMYLPVAWDLESIIQFGLNYTESCQDGWIYPETKKRSLVNEFDLVCGKDRDTEGVQTMLTAGLLIASLIFGFVSDKIVPESPRWLLMKGKLEDAKQVLCYAASVNKKVIPLSLLDKLQLPGKKVTKASVLDYYNNKHFLKVTLVMGCVCFTVGYSYFTLSLKLKNLGVDLHFTQVIPGIMEVPACLCCIFFLEQMGRKWSLIATLFQGSLMCLLVLILPSELKSMIILMVVLGEFSLAASVSVFFIYTAELLPTVLRATGLGLVSLAWAGGAISSLAVSHQKLTLLPIFLCCISATLALFLCSLLPETQDQALPDNPEHCFLQTRNMAEDPFTEEVVSGDGTAEVMKNTILNSTMLKSDLDIRLGRTHLCMARERKETHGMTEPQAPR